MFWKKRNSKKNKQKKNIEFSKKILVGVMITYFIGLFFGMYVIIKMININSSIDLSAVISALFTFIGGPVSIAIGFYSYKAKAENIEKIKKNNYQVKTQIELGGDSPTD